MSWLKYIVSFPFRLISKFILFSMGWSSIDESIFNNLNEYPNTVIVFSHTSYADFYILILYMIADPDKFKHVRTLVKPQPFEYMGWLLRKMGAIPATKVEDTKGGAVNRIVSDLKQSDRCTFLISPKGTIIKRPWRSGYYHIAVALDAKLMVAGLDYEKKRVLTSNKIHHSQGEPAVKEFLEKELQVIVPLFPEEEIVTIRAHDASKRGLIDIYRLSWVIVGIFVIIYML